MKLRIQGSSLRLRISRSELARFAETGYLEETISFGANSALTYALAQDSAVKAVGIASAPGSVTVLLPELVVRAWAATEKIGIAGDVDLGSQGTLSVLVEKDFACLDRSDSENVDTFPNPLAAHACG
jgi:hypothetical protein